MTHAEEMLRTYPADLAGTDRDALARSIGQCVDCAQTCTACADACLRRREPGQVHPHLPGLRRHLRRYRPGAVPAYRVRRQPHPRHAPSVRDRLPVLRRRVRAARPDARALPGLRAGLPALRASLSGAALQPQLTPAVAPSRSPSREKGSADTRRRARGAV